ncbi:MAG: BMC domain-containing protein [Firmicutes bacterium]|jgi:microcompartment protein CcmL/EutN|nr:BMC domain-containing protein [Bacillota bacterium]
MQAIGLFELQGYVPALTAVDAMLKAANVKFLTWEKKLGGWLVTIVIQGEVSAVEAALEAAERQSIRKVAAKAVIANPHPEIMRQIEISAHKYNFKFDE